MVCGKQLRVSGSWGQVSWSVSASNKLFTAHEKDQRPYPHGPPNDGSLSLGPPDGEQRFEQQAAESGEWAVKRGMDSNWTTGERKKKNRPQWPILLI